MIQSGRIGGAAGEETVVGDFVPPDPNSWYVLSYSKQLRGNRDFVRCSVKIEKGVVASILHETVTE